MRWLVRQSHVKTFFVAEISKSCHSLWSSIRAWCPFDITTIQFYPLNVSYTCLFPIPSQPLQRHPLLCLDWSPWTTGCSPYSSPCTQGEVQPSGLWLYLFLLTSFPSILCLTSLCSGCWAFPSSLSWATLGQFSLDLESLISCFPLPALPVSAPWLSRQGKSYYLHGPCQCS